MSDVIDHRERMANQLLMRGHATMKEILKASFGEWPLKGLEMNPCITHDQVIIFKPMLAGGIEKHINHNFLRRVVSTVRAMRAMQMPGPQSGRMISINKHPCPILPWRFGGGDLNLTLGHEVVYILQSDHFDMAHEIFGLETAQNIRRLQKDRASNIILGNMLEKEAAHKSLRSVFKSAFCPVRMAEGVEVQARLHQILMNGYQYWGKMPQNVDELHAALYNVGLKMPQKIVDHLKSLSWMSPVQNFLEAPKDHHDAHFVLRHIQTVSDAFTPPGRQIFWNKTILVLYADLIEMYGDIEGRARFGFGENPKAGYMQMPVDNSGLDASAPH